MADNQINVGRMDGSSILTGRVTGNVYNVNNSSEVDGEQERIVKEVAWEIANLISNSEDLLSSDATVRKIEIAANVINHINDNPRFAQRVLSAIKAGGIQALEQALNHPAASFIIGALKDWQKQNVKQLPNGVTHEI